MHSRRTPRTAPTKRPWGRLAVLMVPFVALGVWLKVLRINRFYPRADAVETATKLSSDVAFGLFWALLWTAILLHLRRQRLRAVALYAAQALTGLIGIYAVLNHAYAMRTGNPLTVKQIRLAVEEAEALSGLVGSEVDTMTIVLLVAVVVGVAFAPLAFGRALEGLFRRAATPRLKRMSLAGVLVLLLAATWTAPTASAAFSLAPAVQLAVAPIREASAYPEELSSDAVLPDPDATRLVPRADATGRNVVFIVLESQRDASVFPETTQPVTPVLDALATQSLRPERGYTVLPHTSKALVAAHCGMPPPPDSENTEADEDGIPQRCLPELLGEHGYQSAFFQSATEHFERRRHTVANLGFDSFTPVNEMPKRGFPKAHYFGHVDDIMLEPARKWLRTTDSPFMLTFLTVTAHHDYEVEDHEAIDFVERELVNRYLNAVHLQDRFVGNVIDMFKELGLYEDTVFVITGDHGEGFGEHRLYQHDNTIYEEGVRIPLMVHDPQRQPRLVDGPANQLALLPTAADALGFALEGEVDYRPSLHGDEPQGPLVVSCWVRGRCTAVLDGDRKLIHHFGDRRDEVYDVVKDPYERNDVVTETDDDWMESRRELAVTWYLDTERWYEEAR